jgi:peptidoglycan DL-endopeptidase CwlO
MRAAVKPLFAWMSLALLAPACATTSPHRVDPHASSEVIGPTPVEPDPAATSETRWRVVASARKMLGKTSVHWPGNRYPDDCSGLVLGVYASVGVPLTGAARPGDSGVTAAWRWTSAHGRLFRTGRPDPGDLVFFHDTYDRDGDGKLDDGLTHIALVESVDGDGTVSIIHRVSRGVMRYRMNLDHPELRRDPRSGRLFNDWLRGSSGRGTPVLTGQLFATFGAVLPPAPEGVRSPLPVLAPQPKDGDI